MRYRSSTCLMRSLTAVIKYQMEKLLHYVTQDMTTPGHATTLDNGNAPSYLSSGTTYYSYDGHYFYTDYAVMLDDYRSETRSHSVNPDSPYYNYFQYLPLRSETSYSAVDLNGMINPRAGSSSRCIMSVTS